jgi:predicted Fe-Mo cluster-binding NifX family protein
MKIAVPTNDGLNLTPDFGQARGFLILNVELGEITGEEMRWNKLSDIICSSDGLLQPIRDCQVVMVNGIGANCSALLSGKKIEVFHTKESIITNAYVHYLHSNLQREANTCCCP